MEELHLKIYGHVQGVFFRAAVQRWAKQLQLGGWVTNLPDRSVFIIAQGKREQLEQLRIKCSQGPSHAHIERIEETWITPTERYQVFEIR